MTRAILYLEEGAVLIDEKGNHISAIFDDIEEEDLENHLECLRYKKDRKV